MEFDFTTSSDSHSTRILLHYRSCALVANIRDIGDNDVHKLMHDARPV